MLELSQIQSQLSTIGAVVGWSLLLLILFRTWASQNPFVWQLNQTIIFLVTFNIGIVCEIHTVYRWLGAVSGINNLAWLIAWLGITTNTYFLTKVLWGVSQPKPLPTWLSVCLGISLTADVVLFVGFIQYTPEYPNHVIPRQLADAFFLLSSFLFGCLATGLATYACYQSCQREKNAITQMRWVIATIICSMAWSYFCLRTVLTIWSYFYPESATAPYLYQMALVAQLLVSSLTPLPYLSTWLLQKLIAPIQLVQQWWTLYQLQAIHESVTAAYRPMLTSNQKATLLERLTNSQFYIYRMIIDILDGKMTLNKEAQLNRLHPENRALLNLLNQVEDKEEYQIVVKKYCQISQQYKKGQK